DEDATDSNPVRKKPSDPGGIRARHLRFPPLLDGRHEARPDHQLSGSSSSLSMVLSSNDAKLRKGAGHSMTRLLKLPAAGRLLGDHEDSSASARRPLASLLAVSLSCRGQPATFVCRLGGCCPCILRGPGLPYLGAALAPGAALSQAITL